MEIKYDVAYQYSIQSNLSLYASRKFKDYDTNMALRKIYTRIREVSLFLLLRHENGKIICRIKCPISPLPVVGEFCPSSVRDIHNFLVYNGWTLKQVINLGLLAEP